MALAQTDDHGARQLNGDWTLDLLPTNNASAYIMTMKLDITPQGVVRGDFYDHVIEHARSFDAKGSTCFALPACIVRSDRLPTLHPSLRLPASWP